MSVPATTSQTVGPFFSIGLSRLYRDALAAPNVRGEHIEVTGRVLDGDGILIPDAIIEVWQANSYGKYAHPEDSQDKSLDEDFSGYGRIPTDEQGKFRFTTIKPGRVPGPIAAGGASTLQAPHLVISVFMRGLLRRLVTRMYFAGDPANTDDPILSLVPAARRATLLATKNLSQPSTYEWTIVSQGLHETVFFDF